MGRRKGGGVNIRGEWGPKRRRKAGKNQEKKGCSQTKTENHSGTCTLRLAKNFSGWPPRDTECGWGKNNRMWQKRILSYFVKGLNCRQREVNEENKKKRVDSAEKKTRRIPTWATTYGCQWEKGNGNWKNERLSGS